MKRNKRLANRIISVILCIAILFSQVNIADAENLNPSAGNTNQVTASSDANAGSGEEKVINDSLDSNETSGTTESAPRFPRKQEKIQRMTKRKLPARMLKRNQQII